MITITVFNKQGVYKMSYNFDSSATNENEVYSEVKNHINNDKDFFKKGMSVLLTHIDKQECMPRLFNVK